MRTGTFFMSASRKIQNDSIFWETDRGFTLSAYGISAASAITGVRIGSRLELLLYCVSPMTPRGLTSGGFSLPFSRVDSRCPGIFAWKISWSFFESETWGVFQPPESSSHRKSPRCCSTPSAMRISLPVAKVASRYLLILYIGCK